MYLLEIFINEDQGVPAQAQEGKDKIIMLFDRRITLPAKNGKSVSMAIDLNVISMENLKRIQFFKTEAQADKWAAAFKKQYQKDIDKTPEGNDKFAYAVTKLL
jgi:hypothetical protein